MRCIGYARVSTEDQNLDLQRHALEEAGCALIFEDAGVSGAAVKRDGLNEALATLGEGDQIIVWRLDRLGRSLPHLIEVVSEIQDRGAEFRSLGEAIDTKSSGGKLIFHFMGAIAEFERSRIIERTKAGQAAAKRRGQHIGRKRKLTAAQIDHARQVIANGQQSVSSMAALLKVDRSTLWRALR